MDATLTPQGAENPFLLAAEMLDPPGGGVAQYYDDPVGFAENCIRWDEDGGFGLTDYQKRNMQLLIDEGRLCVRGPHGLGKDLCVDTPIPTPMGWKRMGDLIEGDVIYDEQGRHCRVLYAEEPTVRQAHHVVFSDGASIVAGAGHLWNAIDIHARPRGPRPARKQLCRGDWRDNWGATKTVETRHMADTLRTPGGQLRWRVPTARPLEAPEADLPIDPYIFGYWLGDGNSDSARLTVGDEDKAHVEHELVAAGYEKGAERCDPRTGAWGVGFRIPGLARPYKEGLRGRLRALGVLGDKHIPTVYLRASIEQRRALVQGLWDSDGYRQAGGADEITLTNHLLAEGVAELLRSLGLSVRVRESASTYQGREIGRRWRIGVRFDFRPYRLRRYEWEPRGEQASRHTQRTIVSMAPVGERLTRCIAVDSPSRLFLAGRDFVPTHNTATNAITVLWFALTRDARGVDWKVITTASAWRQLEEYLWPEIAKWAMRLKWGTIGRAPFAASEMMRLSLRLTHGKAVAVACEDPAKIEGAHADSLLYIWDEAKSVPGATFDASEGAFSGAGAETTQEAYGLASSTPGEPVGRFYDIQARKDGYEDWCTVHVTKEEVIAAGRMGKEWAAKRLRQWGEDSAVYQNRVEGNFATGESDGVIPLAWVELAMERWRALERNGELPEKHTLTCVGADIAEEGGDDTIIALRYGEVIGEIRKVRRGDVMEATGHVKAALSGVEGNPPAIVDAIGIGAGVVPRLREQGYSAVPFKSSNKTKLRDVSRELEFLNCRSAMYWRLRDLLDPANGHKVALPPDDQLISDLTAPKWWIASTGKIQIENKVDLRHRLGRSPDVGEGVLLAFWYGAGVTASAPRSIHKPGGNAARAVLGQRAAAPAPLEAGDSHGLPQGVTRMRRPRAAGIWRRAR